MSNLLVGIYAVYLLFVAYKGNASEIMGDVQEDAPGFLPWMVAVVVLSVLYNNDTARPIVKPFIFLAILTFVLKNFVPLKTEVQKIYQSAVNPPIQTGNVTPGPGQLTA